MTKIPDYEKLEYKRLSSEIVKDRELQFRLFWQSITVTAVIFSFCASIFQSDFWFNFPFVILAPHLILIPTSTIILNRARTANRKSGYLLAAYNKYSNAFNWERDLSSLRQIDGETGSKKPPHRTATIKNMLISITSLEIICMLVLLIFLVMQPEVEIDNFWWGSNAFLGFCYAMFYTHICANRVRGFFCTRYQESIQGYATRWTDILDLDDSAINKIGRWDRTTWNELLNSERTHGIKQFFWRIFWSQPTGSDKTWDFKASHIKPTVLAFVVWPLLALGIKGVNIDSSIINSKRMRNQRVFKQEVADSLQTQKQNFDNFIKKDSSTAIK